MNAKEFKLRADAQSQDVSQINVDACDANQLQLHLDGNCICCGGNSPAESIYDFDYSDEGGMHGTCVGYAVHIFCDGCEMHLPAEVLLKYGAISQYAYNRLMGIETDEDDDLPF